MAGASHGGARCLEGMESDSEHRSRQTRALTWRSFCRSPPALYPHRDGEDPAPQQHQYAPAMLGPGGNNLYVVSRRLTFAVHMCLILLYPLISFNLWRPPPWHPPQRQLTQKVAHQVNIGTSSHTRGKNSDLFILMLVSGELRVPWSRWARRQPPIVPVPCTAYGRSPTLWGVLAAPLLECDVFAALLPSGLRAHCCAHHGFWCRFF